MEEYDGTLEGVTGVVPIVKARNTMAGQTRTAEEPSITIVERVADREGEDPLELPPLYEAIDPDALTRFCRSARSGPRQPQISFTYCGYDVRVRGDEIEITDADRDANTRGN